MNDIYQWAVVGAGPAGIAAVGKLLDAGISAHQILWIDPNFKVGDFGLLWRNVSSNTRALLFTKFLEAVKAFSYSEIKAESSLNQIPPDQTCSLYHMAEPLQWISDKLCESVPSKLDYIHSLKLEAQCWTLESQQARYHARQVILATGAEPISLSYESIESIPFAIAIDKDRLEQVIKPQKTYAVFGSSHSAVMIVRYLVELGVEQIINFYRSPCCYALNMDDWILFDNTGLKGDTARWAKEYIDGKMPANLKRRLSTQANIERYLPDCDKAIYAVGFEPRRSIQMGELSVNHYNEHLGIIAPGLFGFGIAYPEATTDPFGNVEYQVGLWKFMNYLEKVLPIWLHYSAVTSPEK